MFSLIRSSVVPRATVRLFCSSTITAPTYNVPQDAYPSGWIPPRGGTEHLPFRVFRTKLNKNLPVYSDYRAGKRITILRKFEGDQEILRNEVERLLLTPARSRNGCIEISGDHVRALRRWLVEIGF